MEDTNETKMDDSANKEEEGSLSRNLFHLSKFSDSEETIELNQSRVNEIPDLSRFNALKVRIYASDLNYSY